MNVARETTSTSLGHDASARQPIKNTTQASHMCEERQVGGVRVGGLLLIVENQSKNSGGAFGNVFS